MKNGCCKISGIVIRFTGSTTSMALMRLRASEEKLLGMWKLPSGKDKICDLGGKFCRLTSDLRE